MKNAGWGDFNEGGRIGDIGAVVKCPWTVPDTEGSCKAPYPVEGVHVHKKYCYPSPEKDGGGPGKHACTLGEKYGIPWGTEEEGGGDEWVEVCPWTLNQE